MSSPSVRVDIVQATGESSSAENTTLDPHSLPNNLNALEEELQRQYQMAVIRSHSIEAFPAPKSYPLAQKDTASKLYDLIDECHFLTLKLKHAERIYEQSIQALELKWILTEFPTASAVKDDTPEELKHWYNQMISYEKFYDEAIRSCKDENKYALMGEIQLCYNTTYVQEGFQECLEFCTETRSHTLKITITYDGCDATANSSLYMENLKDLVEKCFVAKFPANILIRKMWGLFDETFIE